MSEGDDAALRCPAANGIEAQEADITVPGSQRRGAPVESDSASSTGSSIDADPTGPLRADAARRGDRLRPAPANLLEPGANALRTATGEMKMSREQENKALVGRWFDGFWGNPWNPQIIDELAAPDMLLQYSLHEPRRGRAEVRNFIKDFRTAFPDLKFWGAADLIAEGDYVVGRWEGGGTHTGPAFGDFLMGSLPAASGRKMHFTGTTVIRVENGKIAEEVGLDDGVAALTQLGILKAA
jgi:predicted ester cyclase